ncbi:MAG: type I methionyl aminopeptidase [Candidatus Pacebacteria bacterium]|nr:type I methionyl aminopeptidase [Candidatus Paceibacterota bacterium]
MLPNIYTKEEIEILREGGKRLNFILHEVAEHVREDVTPDELNKIAKDLIKEGGDQASFLNYTVEGQRPYPSALCVSINDEAVHGLSKDNFRKLQEGDIVNIDLGLTHKGLVTDKTLMLGVGKLKSEDINLIETTKLALEAGIEEIKAGKTTGDIGNAIEKIVKKRGFNVVKELGGHGVGHNVHEEPFVPNYGKKGDGDILKEGMVLALEPIVTSGSGKIYTAEDGHTYKSEDGKNVAQWEDTVLVTKSGFEILTR